MAATEIPERIRPKSPQMTLNRHDLSDDELYEWVASTSGAKTTFPQKMAQAGAPLRRSWRTLAMLLPAVVLLSVVLYEKREAIQQWDFDNNMAKTASQVQLIEKVFLLECRHAGTPREGLYLKACRGYAPNTVLVGRIGGQFSELLLRVPPPSGVELRMYDKAGADNPAPDRAVFFACSARILNGQRLFFFHRDLKAKSYWWLWLRDDEMSWYYQTPLEYLTEDEKLVEEKYRKDQNLRFPIGTIPDEQCQPPLGTSSFCQT